MCILTDMRTLSRLVTICLLLVAVPIKGAVGASMMMCGPGHEPTVSAMAMNNPAYVDGQSAQPEHDHSANHPADIDSGELGTTAGGHNHESFAKHGAVKCSICAACCIGGALPASTEILVPASVGTEAPFPALDVHFPWTILAGLERPPRTFLV